MEIVVQNVEEIIENHLNVYAKKDIVIINTTIIAKNVHAMNVHQKIIVQFVKIIYSFQNAHVKDM